MKFLTVLALYGSIALMREYLAICYYKAIVGQSAGLVCVLNFAIEVVDLFVLTLILASVIRYGDFVPALVYAVSGSIGAFLGVKFKNVGFKGKF